MTAFTNVFQSSHRMWWLGCFGLFHLYLIINCSVCTFTLLTLPTFIDFRSKKTLALWSLIFLLHHVFLLCLQYLTYVITFRSRISLIPRTCLTTLMPTSPFGSWFFIRGLSSTASQKCPRLYYALSIRPQAQLRDVPGLTSHLRLGLQWLFRILQESMWDESS